MQRREQGARGRAEPTGVLRAERQPEPVPVAPVRRLLSFGFFLWKSCVILNREARRKRNGLQN